MSTPYEQYSNFMQSLFAPEDTVCFAFIKKDLPTKHIFAPAAEAFTQKAFAVLREQNETYNVFIAMNTFKPELIGQNVGRTKENVLGIKRLYADADVNGEVALENILVSSKVPPPNVVKRPPTRIFPARPMPSCCARCQSPIRSAFTASATATTAASRADRRIAGACSPFRSSSGSRLKGPSSIS